METKKPDIVNEPEAENGMYTYADYLTWQFDEVVECIRGQIFKKVAAALKLIHQKVAGELSFRLSGFLGGKKCEV